MREEAHVPHVIHKRFGQGITAYSSFIISGVFLLSLLAQIRIPLPFTPVPITGQTFGVMLIALLWGSRLGPVTVGLYFLLGFLGFPIFAGGKSGFVGPTGGYLVGMLIAAYVMGFLADRGWVRSLGRAYLTCMLGSLFIFAAGLWGLSFYVPREKLFILGLYPFLLGNFVKSFLAASIATAFSRSKGTKK